MNWTRSRLSPNELAVTQGTVPGTVQQCAAAQSWDHVSKEAGLNHHHDIVQEYVTPEHAEFNQRIVDGNPGNRTSKKLIWRKRDEDRKNGKIHNPMYTSLSACIVCRFSLPDTTHRYVHNTIRKTARYCRECKWQSNWPQTIRAKGYQLLLHPRLCSRQCFDYFHTHRIHH